MDSLDELLERLTIGFPLPITSEEIEHGLFYYLRDKIPVDILYDISIHGETRASVDFPERASYHNERYISRFTGDFKRAWPSPDFPASSSFEIPGIHQPEFPTILFKLIRFQGVPGYDTVEEFKTLATGEAQLQLIDEIRKGVESYFSQRPK